MLNRCWWSCFCASAVLCVLSVFGQTQVKIDVNWDKVEQTSKTSPTLQVVVNPPLHHGTTVSTNAYKAVHELGADYVRYVPWLPYPKLAVAELEPPGHLGTFP